MCMHINMQLVTAVISPYPDHEQRSGDSDCRKCGHYQTRDNKIMSPVITNFAWIDIMTPKMEMNFND